MDSALHRWLNAFEAVIYVNDWPAVLAARLGAPADVGVERHEVRLAGPLGSARTLRIGFAADFHAGPTTQRALLDHAAAALAREAPDVLLLGGDFGSYRAHFTERVLDALAPVAAPLGRFAVLGNHDHRSGAAAVTALLESRGVRVLTNANAALPPPFERTWICGLDDHLLGAPDGAAAMHGAAGARVLLMHQPSGLLDLHAERFDVALCGHTHGGQVALPDGTPLLLPRGRLSRRMPHGRHDVPGSGPVLVTRGVGCSALPVRWNAPAAVMLVTVHGADG